MNTINPLTGKIGLFVPIDLEESIKKSQEDPTGKSWYVSGYATTPDLDLQDDIVDPNGIDISHLITHGYINYEHYQGEEYKIGVPTEGTRVDSDVGLYVEAKLYKNNPYAKSMWSLAKNIADSGVDRKLGFSIEGFARARDKQDPRIIKSTYITNVALTSNPANPHATWDAFAKSFLAGYGITPDTQTGAAALKTEEFARSLYNLSWSLNDNDEVFKNTWKEVGNYLDAMDRYTPEAAVLFLQISKGYSRAEAKEKLEKLMSLAQED